MEIITRHCISNNFSLTKIENNSVYNKKDLDSKVALWKYILKYKYNAKEQESILIGITTLDIDYFAICFAALELALKIVIVDYNRKDEFSNLEYKDPKTQVLAPIDIFLHDVDDAHFLTNATPVNKFKFFTNQSRRTYNVKKIDYSINNAAQFQESQTVIAKPTSIAIRCTSSGTTGTPKIVEHTHQFLYKISKRNSSKFSGDCLHIRNLNHGSSIAVFLLPSLMNNAVTNHFAYNVDESMPFDNFVDNMLQYKDTLSFINFPYPFMIDEFINSSKRNSITWPNLKIQTLSYIQDTSKNAIKEGIFESITSIFGSNETSGPVFECTITKNNVNQNSSYFTKLDEFYEINLDTDGLISLSLPTYDTNIVTNDIFKIVDGFYVHSGRNDIVKVNGEIIDYADINRFNSQFSDTYLVVDSVNNSIYVAFWNTYNSVALVDIESFFSTHYNTLTINKTAVLNKAQFLTGIKLDNELIREYFRNV
tara:strand:+ start:7051 stop:8490 length:1440 start_codon:yes stop_codon:yes gene_type:complete